MWCGVLRIGFSGLLFAKKSRATFWPQSARVPVAQWLEHCISSAKVVGSIPREHRLTKKCITRFG